MGLILCIQVTSTFFCFKINRVSYVRYRRIKLQNSVPQHICPAAEQWWLMYITMTLRHFNAPKYFLNHQKQNISIMFSLLSLLTILYSNSYKMGDMFMIISLAVIYEIVWGSPQYFIMQLSQNRDFYWSVSNPVLSFPDVSFPSFVFFFSFLKFSCSLSDEM